MLYRDIGSLHHVSVVTLGTWNFGDATGTWTKQPEETEDAIVKAAFAAGINAFDTAEGYANGVSEKALGRALSRSGKKREEYFLFSKINADNLASPEKIEEALNRSLEAIGTPYLDLYQIHWPNHNIDLKPAMKKLEELKTAGKIKSIGVSNFGPVDLSDAVASGVKIDSNQVPYSLLNRAIEYEVLPSSKQHNVAILAYSPIAQGLLSGKYKSAEDLSERSGLTRTRFFHHSRSPLAKHKEEGCENELFEAIPKFVAVADKMKISPTALAIAWVLSQQGVASAIIGASKPEQIAENVAAVDKALSSEVQKELADLTESIKKAIGYNPDVWAPVTRYR